MTDEQTQRERERFEAWAKSVCMIDEDFLAAWQGWLARAQEADKPPMTWREQEADQ